MNKKQYSSVVVFILFLFALIVTLNFNVLFVIIGVIVGIILIIFQKEIRRML